MRVVVDCMRIMSDWQGERAGRFYMPALLCVYGVVTSINSILPVALYTLQHA